MIASGLIFPLFYTSLFMQVWDKPSCNPLEGGDEVTSVGKERRERIQGTTQDFESNAELCREEYIKYIIESLHWDYVATEGYKNDIKS